MAFKTWSIYPQGASKNYVENYPTTTLNATAPPTLGSKSILDKKPCPPPVVLTIEYWLHFWAGTPDYFLSKMRDFPGGELCTKTKIDRSIYTFIP